MKPDLLVRLNELRAGKQRCCLVRHLSGERAYLVTDKLDDLPSVIRDAIAQAYATDRSVTTTDERGPVFIQVFNPPLRLMVVGAVHIAQPLAGMARLCGYEVIIIDPRSAFATEERFPGTRLELDWPDEALARLQPDRRSAIVALTHDPKLDDPALDQALQSEAFYIAALGSRKNHAARCERLAAGGHEASTLNRIHGPAGLDIGAVSPAEIALAIMAQMTASLRRPAA